MPPVPGELIRRRLVAELAGRWDVAVTTVVAGAGFGRLTALAQAVRHNRRTRGVDAWISCEPGDEDADPLAAAAVRALGSPWAGLDPDTAVIGALQRVLPIPVCLVVDDVQELPEPSSAADLLASVVRRLPAHAHLALASRRPSPCPWPGCGPGDVFSTSPRTTLRSPPPRLASWAHTPGRPQASRAWPVGRRWFVSLCPPRRRYPPLPVGGGGRPLDGRRPAGTAGPRRVGHG